MKRSRLLFAASLLFTLAFPPRALPADDAAARIDALIQRAETARLNGDPGAAVEAFNSALVLSKQHDNTRHAFISGNLAGLHLANGEPARAEQVLLNAVRAAESEPAEREFLPRLHNDLGCVYTELGDKEKAGRHFGNAAQLAAGNNDSELEAGALFNQLLLQTGDVDARVKLYGRALRAVETIADAGARDELLLRLGILSLSDYESARSAALLDLAVKSLDRAAAGLSPERQPASLHEAWGRAGRARKLAGDDIAAVSNYRRAIRGSLQQNNLEQLYRWYWELARIKADGNALPEALQYYELAVDAHQKLFIGGDGGADLGAQAELYNEFLSLLLDDPKPGKAAFEKAVKTLEGLRTASIQDYFQDSCVSEARLSIGNIADIIDADTAILYPLMLKDRLRVLLVTRDDIHQRISGLKQAEVTGAAGQLRKLIRNNDELSAQSRRLSAALIEPFADIFKRRDITHLIVVPDHITAAIPYAALDYDGRFLLESFSLSIAPALELTQSDRAKAGKARALYAGVSLPVFNLPALQRVRDEIALASNFMPGETLLNSGFSAASVGEKLASG
ncbi:MAG TPA: CHAT domain-containing protein, partial [Gammaproteobacteria bacterium]